MVKLKLILYLSHFPDDINAENMIKNSSKESIGKKN